MGAVLAPVVEFIDLTGDDNNCDNIEMAVGEVQKQVGSEVEVIEILESPRKEGEVQEWAEVEVVGCFVEIPESPPIQRKVPVAEAAGTLLLRAKSTTLPLRTVAYMRWIVGSRGLSSMARWR